ncbi:GrpB family protein [Pseudomonas aeruginosa]|uniref:GrpB family protein n=1 Tax=Pseudomonas aeruginosa TaxID=287 RepID=UPI0029357BC6|nr:GrpB family protein [Pseudomonas aeruginosa]MDV2657680.1 GrpB family protein [Pseudomonas aeruginosa]
MNTEKKTLSWPDANEITIFEAGDPNENPWVLGQPKIENIEVEAYDPTWATQFQTLRNSIDIALAGKALAIEHVGSTAVPGLPAKPVIDIDVIVDDPEDEDAYVPALAAMGYTLTVRERSWYQHRMLRHDSPRANVHVFGPNCPEHIRHVLFRDWLCTHPEDRDLYAGAKIQAREGVDTAQAYNMKKQAAVRAIYKRIFEFHSLLKEN